jgi:mevalonate pyrophosphate decarboxylase
VHTIRDFGVIFERVPIVCDNTSVISVAKNPVFHKRTRHIERRYHFLRDHIEKGDIEMIYIDTKRQLADIFTKLLDSSRFAALREKLVFAIIMAWFEGDLVSYLVYLYILFFSCIFFILT